MYSNKPQKVSPHIWYYEETKGIVVVYPVRDNDHNYLRTDQFTISWQKLRNSIKRSEED